MILKGTRLVILKTGEMDEPELEGLFLVKKSFIPDEVRKSKFETIGESLVDQGFVVQVDAWQLMESPYYEEDGYEYFEVKP